MIPRCYGDGENYSNICFVVKTSFLSIFFALQAQHPSSIGLTLANDESACYCEFGPAAKFRVSKNYKTCLFSAANPGKLNKGDFFNQA